MPTIDYHDFVSKAPRDEPMLVPVAKKFADKIDALLHINVNEYNVIESVDRKRIRSYNSVRYANEQSEVRAFSVLKSPSRNYCFIALSDSQRPGSEELSSLIEIYKDVEKFQTSNNRLCFDDSIDLIKKHYDHLNRTSIEWTKSLSALIFRDATAIRDYFKTSEKATITEEEVVSLARIVQILYERGSYNFEPFASAFLYQEVGIPVVRQVVDDNEINNLPKVIFTHAVSNELFRYLISNVNTFNEIKHLFYDRSGEEVAEFMKWLFTDKPTLFKEITDASKTFFNK